MVAHRQVDLEESRGLGIKVKLFMLLRMLLLSVRSDGMYYLVRIFVTVKKVSEPNTSVHPHVPFVCKPNILLTVYRLNTNP